MTPKENPSPNAADRLAEAAMKLDAFLDQFDLDEQERLLRYALDHVVPRLKAFAAITKQQATPEAESLQSIMEVNAWRAAMIGLCQGRESNVGTPEKAADYLRAKLRAQSPLSQVQREESVTEAWNNVRNEAREYGSGASASMGGLLTAVENYCDLRVAASLTQVPAVAQAVPEKCSRCCGSGVVDDGWLTHSEGGAEYSEPIKLVKDCPKCAGLSKRVSGSQVGDKVDAKPRYRNAFEEMLEEMDEDVQCLMDRDMED